MTESSIQPWLREILRCPSCLSEFRPAEGSAETSLTCSNGECGLVYRIEGGIPVLLVDEATKPGA